MSSNLYETLNLDRNATPEEIRKAYRRRALQTHPDRLPPGTSEQDKADAAEQFRQVNNAYEVLSDERNRELYDRAGVWPPTTPNEPRRSTQNTYNPGPFPNNPFSYDPFANNSFYNTNFGFGGRGFAFTDPFELFNSIFGNMNSPFDDDPFFSDFNDRMNSTMMPPMMSQFGGGMFNNAFGPGFGQGFGQGFGAGFGPNFGPGFGGGFGNMQPRAGISQSQMMSINGVGPGGRWVSQSSMTRTIGGRTETITTQRDSQGNEHIRYTSPNGERYTINGVEQPLEQMAITSGSQSAAPPPPANISPSKRIEPRRDSSSTHSQASRSPERHHRSSSHHSHSSHHSSHHSSRPHDPYQSGRDHDHNRPREPTVRDYGYPDRLQPPHSPSPSSHSVHSTHPPPPPNNHREYRKPSDHYNRTRYDSSGGKGRSNGWLRKVKNIFRKVFRRQEVN